MWLDWLLFICPLMIVKSTESDVEIVSHVLEVFELYFYTHQRQRKFHRLSFLHSHDQALYVLRIITYLNQACMQYPAYQYNNYQLNWKDNDNYKYYYLVMICITLICMVPSFVPLTRHACMEGVHNIAYLYWSGLLYSNSLSDL